MNGRDPFPELVLRPVGADDVERVVATFRRLSPQSVYRRFFTLMPDPSPLVRRSLQLVDHADHEALLVLAGDDVVAVAQWDRTGGDADEAEIAVTVEDAWQHRGLGHVLVRALAADARRHGIAALTASVLTDNRPALGLAARGRPATVDVDGPETRFTFPFAS